MKKLFGFLTLFLCLLLTACNMNLLSDRSGSIDFSIPTKDIIDAANNYAARGADNDQTWNYAFLVQIKGNRGYYDYQLQTLTVETHEDFGNLNPGQINGLYVKNNNVNFSFNNVPAGQKYKIMFDAFIYYTIPNGSGSYYKTFSGNTENIKVKPGKPSEVGITAKAPDESMFTLVIVTENDGTFTIPANSAMDMLFAGNPSGNSPVFEKKYGELIYKNNAADMTPKVVKDVYLSLSPDANIDSNSFNISFLYGEHSNPSRYNLKFSNNVCSIKSFLLQGLKFSDDDIRNNVLDMTIPGEIQITKAGFTFKEPASDFQFKSRDEYISGHTSQTLTFEKKTYEEGNKKVLLYVADINSIMNTSLGNLDTSVLVLKTKGDNPISSGNQLYYKLEPDQSGTVPLNYGQDEDEIDGQDLYRSTSCLNHKIGENKYVLPFHDIDIWSGTNYLVLFIPYEGNSETVDISFDIDYCLFPENLNVYVFCVGQEYDNNGDPTGKYRYETHIPFYEELIGGKNYNASLQGYVCNVSVSAGNFIKKSVTLTGELYNSDSNHDFYPLSNGNKPIIQTYTGSDEAINDFIFYNIREPLTYANKYFMCTAPCDDVNTLLVVRDYYFGIANKKD